MNIAAPLLLLAAGVLTPVSDRVPDLNVAPSCRGAANVPLADSQSYDACMKEEASAREQLLRSWQGFQPADRASCTADASSAGLASYVELLVCLQMASKYEPERRTTLKGARRK